MPVIDQGGLSSDELGAVSAALARDPGLRGELELILPALDRGTRRAFWRAFASGCDVERPAAAVLEALVAAARSTSRAPVGRRPPPRD